MTHVPFLLDKDLLVSRTGFLEGFRHIHKFGRNGALGTAVEDIWSIGGTYTWLTVAATLELISTDANDDDGGSGAQKVIIEGLDANWVEIEEEVVMNGDSATTATTNSFIRVNEMYVSEDGAYSQDTAGSNAGTITCRVSSAGATQAVIGIVNSVSMGQSQVARYSVPKGHKAYLMNASATADTGKTVSLVMFQRPGGNVVADPFTSKKVIGLYEGLGGELVETWRGIEFPAYTDLWWAGWATQSASVSVDFEMILCEDNCGI